MKVKITVYIHYLKYDWDAEGNFEVFSFKANEDSNRTFVCSQEFEIEVPDDYSPRAQKIITLEKQKQNVMDEYQKRINKLQALEYKNDF